jgi:two-component system, NarL family, response regulator NreC
MSIKVIVADDHRIVREGLCSLLEKEKDITVVGQAENGQTAVRLAQQLNPDVVVMDITMPDLNGMEAAQRICAEARRTKVIGLSMHSDRQFVTRMLKAGAAGYLLKDSAFGELAEAIRAVVAGRKYLSPSIGEGLIDDYINHPDPSVGPVFSALSVREREVLQLLAEGHSAKEIAIRLHVSVKTVETHRRHIMEKLDVHSVAELTKLAVREGLTSLEA